MLVDKDARRMDVVRKPDGTPPDMPRPADILVYEVRTLMNMYGWAKSLPTSLMIHVQVLDSAMIGEGALHAVAAAQAKLLAPDALLVPAAATVFCQPLQLRRAATAAGFDVAATNCWHWRPDYEGIELDLCR